jgi:hypothetical protein
MNLNTISLPWYERITRGESCPFFQPSILHKRILLLPFCGVKDVSLPFRVLLDF